MPALAFMFASTNLVFELGIVLWLLMGWRFVLAEGVGAFVLIGVMWLLVALTLPKGLEAGGPRRMTRRAKMRACCHDHGGTTDLGRRSESETWPASRTPSPWTGA